MADSVYDVDFLKSLEENHAIQFLESVADWQAAVCEVFKPLLASHAISEHYVPNVIAKTKEYGPYYIITPNVAMPHARPEDGALHNAFSLLLLKQPVPFDSKSRAQIIIGLAAANADVHLSVALPQIVAIFEQQTNIQRLLGATTPEEVIAIIQSIDYLKYLK